MRNFLLAMIGLAAGWGVSLSAAASEIPTDGRVTSGAGVNIHFTRGHGQDLDLIAAAGIKFVRMDFFWTDTERSKGVYDWSSYDELTANLERRGICAYYIFDYSNPLYEQTVTDKNGGQVLASPRQADSVAAFARWAAAAAKHFQGHHIIWELWNEPNGSFWEPEADVTAYSRLAVATAKAVREADPSATIVGPASSGFPWPFLESFLKSGVLDYLDAVSVHPYRAASVPPETAANDYARLRQLIATNLPAGKKMIPILSGEWGYNTSTHGVTPETQAAFCARQQLANALEGIPVSIWYDWKNDGADPKNGEHNFGLVWPNLTPKPSYLAMQTFTQELAGYGIEERMPTANRNDFVLMLTNSAGNTKLAAWTLDQPHTAYSSVSVANAESLTWMSSGGQTLPAQVDHGRLVLPLDIAPRYITIKHKQ